MKQGQNLMYHRESTELNELGFIIGLVYQLQVNDKGLRLASGARPAGEDEALIMDLNGNFTDHANHFKAHQCPLVLPRGYGQNG